MFRGFFEKLKESFFAVFPMAIIIILLSVIFVPVDALLMWKFVFSSVLLIVGMTFFTLGADQSMLPIGAAVGDGVSKTKKLSVMIILAFIIGFIITFAEPDLAVLASQVTNINKWLFMIVVSVGVGVFLILATLKILFQIKLSTLLAISYGAIFVLAIFVPNNFISLAFDSGSISTGTISVPFLISFGLGLSSLHASKNAMDDTFGFIALCSIGPIVSVMLMGAILPPMELAGSAEYVLETSNLFVNFSNIMISNLFDVFIVLAPILIIFFLFQMFVTKLPPKKIVKICVGVVYTFVGMVLFLTGVELGFLPMAHVLGEGLISHDMWWILFPLSAILGYIIIAAEPAVQVLKKQVEEITAGTLSQKTILITISIGVALSVLMAMFRTIYNLNIVWLILPFYVLSVALSFVNSPTFTAIAFDAGGTATGTLSVSFILPFLAGIADSPNSSFGTIALIAIMPIFTLQLLGVIYTIGTKRAERRERKRYRKHVEIIEFDN